MDDLQKVWQVQTELSRAMEELRQLRASPDHVHLPEKDAGKGTGIDLDVASGQGEKDKEDKVGPLKLRAAEARVRALSARFAQIVAKRTTGELELRLEKELREVEQLLHEAERRSETKELSGREDAPA
jgi:hypothetical protein